MGTLRVREPLADFHIIYVMCHAYPGIGVCALPALGKSLQLHGAAMPFSNVVELPSGSASGGILIFEHHIWAEMLR